MKPLSITGIAGAVDGVKNRWQELYYITLPTMRPQMMLGAILAITGAFGFGGVNAHLVLQSCPEVPQSGYVKKKKYLILLSAKKKANVPRRA